MKKEENKKIEFEKMLNETNFETITDDELAQIFGGMSDELKEFCKKTIGHGHFLCNYN